MRLYTVPASRTSSRLLNGPFFWRDLHAALEGFAFAFSLFAVALSALVEQIARAFERNSPARRLLVHERRQGAVSKR
jgi:hypothetical protein